MINKIISGGQTGADRAALDAAMEYGVPHGGWIPKGRRTEDGRLPDRYCLRETGDIGYPQRTELNILDSDGTVIFSHGKLAGGSALTQKLAKKHTRPCLHIDLNEISDYKAVVIIRTWIDAREIEILNVAGPRGSKDPLIYNAVKGIIKSVLYPPPEHILQDYPKTVEEAVDRLMSTLSSEEKETIARTRGDDLPMHYPPLGRYIREKFGLWSGNRDLMESCRQLSGEKDLHVDSASVLIIKELWLRLRKALPVRRVK